jgi:uncharacterized membrane protein YfhO
MRYGTEKELTVQYMDSIVDVKKRVEEMELGNFYRMEFRRFATINDGALLHYPGVNQFSSLAPGGISGLMKNIGVSATGNSYRYYDPTPMIDALLGVKYILNGEIDGGENAFAQRYEPVGQEGNIWIYRNPQVLPVGFAVSDAVTSWEPEQETPFVSQDALAAAATGETEAMYRPLSWDSYEVRNITVTESAPNHLDYEVTAPEQLDLVPEATIRYVSDRQQYLYLYTNVSNTKRLVYRTEGTRQDREIAAGNGMIDVGWVDAGEVIEIHVELTEHGEFEKDYRKNGSIFIAAAGYQPEVWDRVYEQLNRHPWTLTAWGDTSLTGTIDADEHEILFTSIPYIRGWEASVDGTPVEITPIGHNGFIGVALPSGTHEVHLEFHVPALKAGILLSVLTWLLIAVWCVFERRIRPEQ